MSTHEVKVVEVDKIMPHPDAERLEVTEVNGWQVVVGKGQFKEGDKAIYIEPDYVVDTNRPEFAFLAKHGKTRHRLKAVRLRGVTSFGLLIPMPSEILYSYHIGDNVMDEFGITRYEPPVKYLHSEEIPDEDAPKMYVPKFDVESFEKFKHLIRPGEDVIATEKIHGANARYVWHDGKLYMGSRSRWIRPDVDSVWKAAFDATPEMLKWLQDNPDNILFGEVYGKVQSLRYGLGEKVAFAGFAALNPDGWVSQVRLFDSLWDAAVPRAPLVYSGPFKYDMLKVFAEGDSTLPSAPIGHMREGLVICPVTERFGPSAGRLALKMISERYWTSEEE